MQDDYIPPNGLEVSIKLGAGDYSPPSALAVSIKLGGEAVVAQGRVYPAGVDSQHFGAPVFNRGAVQLFMTGFSGFSYGTSVVYNSAVVIPVTGIPAGAFGKPGVFLFMRYARAVSIGPGGVGASWVSELHRSLKVSGSAYGGYGSAVIINKNRFIPLAAIKEGLFGRTRIEDKTKRPVATGISSFASGRPVLMHEHRALYVSGILALGIGPPRVQALRRYLEPRSVSSFISGTPWVSLYVRRIQPEELESFGGVANRAWIADKTQVRRLNGFASSRVSGHAWIKDSRSFIYVKAFVNENLQVPVVYNLTTEVAPLVIGRDLEGFAEYGKPLIFLRNATVAGAGILSTRFGLGTQAYFFVGDVDSVSLQDTFRLGALLISHRERSIYVSGFDSGYISPMSNAYNAARAFEVEGIPEANAYGRSWLDYGIRYIQPSQVSPREGYGIPWVSDGLREVSGINFGRAASYISTDLMVTYAVRMVQPASVYPPVVERFDTEVVSRFNIIKPIRKTEDIDEIGAAQVSLRDIVVRVRPFAPEEASIARVENQDRGYVLRGEDFAAVGKPYIADSRRTIALRGSLMGGVGTKPEVSQQVFGPPPARGVRPIGIWTFESIPTWQVPSPIAGVQEITDVSLGAQFAAGTATVRSNTLFVDPGIWTQIRMGNPSVSPFYISPGSLGAHLDPSALGKPRMTPFHIYAPSGSAAPPGYEADAPVGGPHVIDGRLYTDGAMYNGSKVGVAWVPRPHVTLWRQTVVGRGHASLLLPAPRVENLKREAIRPPHYIKPQGLNSLRVGWLRFPPDILEPLIWTSSVVGNARVARPVDLLRTIRLSGIAPGVFPRQDIMLFHRNIYGSGWDSRVFGTQWASFRVRSLKPIAIISKQVVPSTAYIDFKVRYLSPAGAVHLNPPSAFNGLPTTLRNRYNGRVLSVKSLVPGALGALVIAQKTQYLVPRAMFYVPLFPPTVKGRTEIQALGAEHTEFGHVRKYEEGVVYPHEFNPAGFGRAFIVTPREVQGFDSAVVEYPVIAKHVVAYGTPGEQFGVMVFTNEVCCEGCG